MTLSMMNRALTDICKKKSMDNGINIVEMAYMILDNSDCF